MAELHHIYVKATNSKPFPPEISDDENHYANTEEGDKELTTELGPGDTVSWVKQGDIESIKKVYVTSGQDLFIEDPVEQSDGSWQATTVEDLDPGSTCEYEIEYYVESKKYTQDPKLTLKPNVGSGS